MLRGQRASQPYQLELPNFIRKLDSMLRDEANHDAIHWTPDGTGFQISDEHLFCTRVLAQYYRHSNIPSFIRQLNMYGFRKVKEDYRHYYMHPYFVKDLPELSRQISRKPEKKVMFLEELRGLGKENKPEQDGLRIIEDCEELPKSRRVCFMDNIISRVTNESSFRSIKMSEKLILKSESLANLIARSEATIINCKDLEDDRISICDQIGSQKRDLADEPPEKPPL